MSIAQKIHHLLENIIFVSNTLWWRCVLNNHTLNVYGRIKVRHPQNVKIGENVTINDGSAINARGKVYIGNNVKISGQVIITTAELTHSIPRKHFSDLVRIEDDVWLGTRATILPGVTIGKNAIVGAGAVVVKTIKSNSIVGGVPARNLKKKQSTVNS